MPRCAGLAHATTPLVARAYIGTSGWVYAGWREHLYADTPIKKWLQVASRAFDALEINGSFYTQIKPETYARWFTETPPDFRFALKGHRFVTHYKRLRDCRDSIIRLRDQVQPLREKLAAVIWQLSSNFACREDGGLARLDDFMQSLKAWPDVRHSLELRHKSWFTEAVAQVLRANNVAVCMGDAPDFPLWKEVTADLVYVRLHGHTRKYHSSYSEQSLRAWAQDTKRWLAEGRDVHVYFDNDAEGHAVRNALRFQELVVGSAPREIPAACWDKPSPERKPYPMASWGPSRAVKARDAASTTKHAATTKRGATTTRAAPTRRAVLTSAAGTRRRAAATAPKRSKRAS